MHGSSKAKDGNAIDITKAIIHLLDTQLFQFVLVDGDTQRHLTWQDVRTYANAGMVKSFRRVNPNVYVISVTY